MDDNIGMECWKLVYWHSILKYNAWYYWNIIPKLDQNTRILEVDRNRWNRMVRFMKINQEGNWIQIWNM